MNNNKTPGSDGIPVDFYKVFWNKVSNVFYEMAIESYRQNILPSTTRKGILNLIPKAKKDTRFIKNLRPITLLNTDYKIIEKAIANKIIPALSHIIHPDQRGFMKDRRISVNIRKMLDIMYEAQEGDLEAIVLSLDFVKCFDKCSFSILHGSLEFFDFGEYVKQWTYILYKEFSVKIQNNGFFSEEIDIQKGVHQGGCCSSVYFLVIAEILAISLRENKDIEGLTIKEIRNLLSQFADDMDIFSLCTENSVKAICQELRNFKNHSGFTVSYDKTTIYRIGSLRHSDAQMYNIDEFAWSSNDITVLGVVVAHEQILDKNYSTIVEKAKSVLQAWYNRGLSLLGKVQVVNTLVASLFVYKMMVLPMIPVNIIRNMENIIRDYIWSGKKSKVALRILQNPKDQGGLQLVNLRNKEIALKATWPQILYKEQQYASMVYKIMRCSYIQQDIWRCNLAPQDVKDIRINNQFWADVLKCWCEFSYYRNVRIENQIIWYNSRIKIGKKIFFWKDCWSKGLMYVHQLFSDKGYKSDQQVKIEFGLTKLRYNGLKASIPLEWKEFFSSTPQSVFTPLAPHNYHYAIVVYGNGLSRKVYRQIADDAMLVHSKYYKWIQQCGPDFCEGVLDFAMRHKELYKTTNVPKLRSFQYRLLQHGLVTNIQLCHWDIVASDECSFCANGRETTVHLFTQCPKAIELWDQVKLLLHQKYNIQEIDLSPRNIIWNTIVKSKASVGNFICLITKQFIYAQRCLGRELTLPNLKQHINRIEQIEKYIAIKNSRLEVHQKKWYKASYVPRNRNQYDRDIMDSYVEQYIRDIE